MIFWENLFLYEISSLNGRLIKDNVCESSLEAKCYGVKDLRDLALKFFYMYDALGKSSFVMESEFSCA